MTMLTIDVMRGRKDKIALPHLIDTLQGRNMVGILETTIKHGHENPLATKTSLMQSIEMYLFQLLAGCIVVAFEFIESLGTPRAFERFQRIGLNVNQFCFQDVGQVAKRL